jgi:hypothetical protein
MSSRTPDLKRFARSSDVITAHHRDRPQPPRIRRFRLAAEADAGVDPGAAGCDPQCIHDEMADIEVRDVVTVVTGRLYGTGCRLFSRAGSSTAFQRFVAPHGAGGDNACQ